MDIDEKFRGYIREPETKKLPQQKTIEKWTEEANNNPVLQENHLVVVNKTKHTFFKILAVMGIFLLIAIVVIGYVFAGYIRDGINNGSFRPQVNQDINPNIDANVNLTVPTANNNYNTINPSINIYPNITIKVDKIITNSS